LRLHQGKSPSSDGEKYSDERNSGISSLQDVKLVRIHGVKEFRFRFVSVVGVIILDLVKDETEVIDAQFRAKLQKKYIDRVD
jgi:hypothetical protein